MIADNDNTQMEEQRDVAEGEQTRTEAVDNVRRQLEEMVMYEPITATNVAAAIELARISGSDTSELRALQTTSSATSEWVSMESYGGGYESGLDDWNNIGTAEPQPVREDTEEEKAAKFAERLRLAEELKIKVLKTKSRKMSRTRTVILEEIATSVINNVDSALASITEQSTHENFVSYLSYLSEYMDRCDTHIDNQISKEQLKKKKLAESMLRNKPDMRSKLFCPMGIEYTYHPKIRRPKIKESAISENSRLNNIAYAGGNIKFRTYTMTLDLDGSPRFTPNQIESTEQTTPENTERQEIPDDLLSAKLATEDPVAEEQPQEPEPVAPNPNYEPSVFSRGNRRDTLDKIVTRILTRINEVKRATGLYPEARVYADNGVVEVCSPVHRDWKSMREWYRWMVNELGSSVTVINKKKGSGGGHINCAMPKKLKEKFMYNLLVDIGNRPYLNWIFNDPSDNHTANCMWDSKDMQRIYEHVHKNKEKWDADDSDFISTLGELITLTNSRGFAIRVKSEYHFEFRCFDAIRNERDLEDIVIFVSEYMRSIYSMTVAGNMFDSIGGTTDDLPNFAATARTDFNRLLRKIGLDPENYRRFIDRNFEVRRKVYGKNNLI
jgi:hypothetical protein